MSDIFLSYSSKDKARVAPLCEQLTALGYSVFWDQQVPAGCDWDTWIRQELIKSKCAIVVWSLNSVASGNVRHEATVAEKVGKLIPVLLDPLTPDQFPMGLFNVQAANLVGWEGESRNSGWLKLSAEVEAKIKPHAPLWLQNTIHTLEASLMAEKARVQATESRMRSLEAKIGGDASASLDAERERTRATDSLAALHVKLEQEFKLRNSLIEQGRALEERLAQAAVDQHALSNRLGVVTRGGKSKLQGSRGHLGVLDLLAWIAMIGGLIFTVAPVNNFSDNVIREFILIGAAAAGVWALIVLIRLILKRRISEVALSPLPVQTPTQLSKEPDRPKAPDPVSTSRSLTDGAPNSRQTESFAFGFGKSLRHRFERKP